MVDFIKSFRIKSLTMMFVNYFLHGKALKIPAQKRNGAAIAGGTHSQR
jgi:hypothetical protein